MAKDNRRLYGCNIWMVCLKLNWFFYGLSRILNFSEFVWTVSYSVWDVFNKFLLIYTTDRSKISSDQKRFFIALSLYPLSFFANTPFKGVYTYVYVHLRECILMFMFIKGSVYLYMFFIWVIIRIQSSFIIF